jgi:tetratricopeptide (TPR) repeat protein
MFAVAAAAAAACAAPKQAWQSAAPEAFVEVLPRDAELSVDGRPLGKGAHVVPVPDAAHVYVIRAVAPGYAPAERSADGARLAAARVGLVLRPLQFGDARRLDLDDGSGLAAAAALLHRTGRSQAALEYAERAVEAGSEVALGQRVIGDAAWALGRRQRAIDAYSAYLRLAPEAPDRGAIQSRVEDLRGDLTLPARVQ